MSFDCAPLSVSDLITDKITDNKSTVISSFQTKSALQKAAMTDLTLNADILQSV